MPDRSTRGPGRTTAPAKRSHPLRGFAELVLTVAVAVAVLVGVEAFIVKPYRIPSGSMEPTLHINQRILVNRLAGSPSIGDVIVFHPPAGADPDMPVCGNSGEGAGHRQACDSPTPQRSKQTFVKRVVGLPGDRISIRNGKVIRNGRLEHAPYAQPCPDPANCDFGQTIVVPRGDYFAMGDNRDDSDDSRYWGPVPKKWIIGNAFATYWPLDRIGTL